jgi:hypothetical protein
MVVKTFRGQLADDGQERIRLSTIKGKVGYRIIKFQLIGDDPQTHRQESVVKIYKEEQSSLTGLINFTDSALLAVAVHKNYEQAQYPMGDAVIFDNETFNQDIYVTHTDEGGSTRGCNYYLELEVIPLDDAGAEYTTLKDMRST